MMKLQSLGAIALCALFSASAHSNTEEKIENEEVAAEAAASVEAEGAKVSFFAQKAEAAKAYLLSCDPDHVAVALVLGVAGTIALGTQAWHRLIAKSSAHAVGQVGSAAAAPASASASDTTTVQSAPAPSTPPRRAASPRRGRSLVRTN